MMVYLTVSYSTRLTCLVSPRGLEAAGRVLSTMTWVQPSLMALPMGMGSNTAASTSRWPRTCDAERGKTRWKTRSGFAEASGFTDYVYAQRAVMDDLLRTG